MKQINKLIGICGAALLTTAGVAFAQAHKTPGGNIPTAQGPCSLGYEASVLYGRMNLSAEQMDAIDTNDDGRISRSEFNSACANKLFEQNPNA
ncbi:MAG: hypothetical protein F9K29_05720 [Hyphomicrobiaceae bacterium]|nr:MAG: hypothetical protein F9K29_05720 [Hyphomicrobiaceae bacterium]